MRRIALAAGLLLVHAAASFGQYQPSWRLRHYDLDYQILPAEHLYRGTATLRLENVSGRPQGTVPLALYRLQHVDLVDDLHGAPLRFTAPVVTAPDWPEFQAVSLEVQLPREAAPSEAVELRVRHSGPMLGYTEVKRYTTDTIGKDLSLLRQDTLAYPQLGPVTDRDLSGNLLAQIAAGWTFRLAVVVPKPLVVAASGRSVGRTEVDGDRWRYEFESTLPTWRIDAVAAHYSVVEQPERGLRGYFFVSDAAAANAAMEVMAKSIEAYTRWFGPIAGSGYTLIEVPPGYGAQAGTGYQVQTADALGSPESMGALAHEIAHTWNVPSREEHLSRFLDEAFATYFQALMDEVLAGSGGTQRRLEEYRRRYLREVDAHPEWGAVAVRDDGRADLGDLSYSKGPWVLAVLDEIVGRDDFQRIVRTFLARYRESGATPADFRAVAEEVSGRGLDRFWAEWMDEGEPSTVLLRENTDPDRIAARYR
jgi:aminopeptidase N